MMNCPLRFDVLSLFPQTVEAFTGESIVGKAIGRGLIEVQSRDLRDWAKGKHRDADDRPFGGGAGMVLKPEPLFDAVEEISTPHSTVVYMAPDGEKFTSQLAKEFSQCEHIVLLSGHYEGIDQRVRDHLIHKEVSIGDYVLTNGALAASVLIDAVSRHVPGVLGDDQSLDGESFEDQLLGCPQYTRPEEFRGFKVPEILLSGNHEAIARWRHEKRVEKTRRLRPDLITITNQ
ncbi:MAG: tRNA (guanosine(37)-N1)-methyltransferase TrmD [Opitutae bacterium]